MDVTLAKQDGFRKSTNFAETQRLFCSIALSIPFLKRGRYTYYSAYRERKRKKCERRAKTDVKDLAAARNVLGAITFRSRRTQTSPLQDTAKIYRYVGPRDAEEHEMRVITSRDSLLPILADPRYVPDFPPTHPARQGHRMHPHPVVDPHVHARTHMYTRTHIDIIYTYARSLRSSLSRACSVATHLRARGRAHCTQRAHTDACKRGRRASVCTQILYVLTHTHNVTASGALWRRRRRRRSCIQAERNIGGRTGVAGSQGKGGGQRRPRDDCAIDNSNRLIIRTGGGASGKKGDRSRATATQPGPRPIFSWSSPRFFFFSFSFADRARTHEIYFGYSRCTLSCPAENRKSTSRGNNNLALVSPREIDHAARDPRRRRRRQRR